MRYWKRIDASGNTYTVESYSHDLDIAGAIEIDGAEFNAYLASLLFPTPVPDSPNMVTLKKYLSDPHSGLPDLETAFLALVRLFLGIK